MPAANCGIDLVFALAVCGLVAMLFARVFSKTRPGLAHTASAVALDFVALMLFLGVVFSAMTVDHDGSPGNPRVTDRNVVLLAFTLFSSAALGFVARRSAAHARAALGAQKAATSVAAGASAPFAFAVTAAAYDARGGSGLGLLLVTYFLFWSALVLGAWNVLQRRGARSRAQSALTSLFFVLVLVSVPWTHWPLRLSYAGSRAILNDLERRFRAGEHVQMPVRAGLFTIRRAEIARSQALCLWICNYVGGSVGFVENGRLGNVGVDVALDDDWHLMSED